MQQPIVDMLVWMRVPGDTIFSVGAVALAWFVLRLWVAPGARSTWPARPNRSTADRAQRAIGATSVARFVSHAADLDQGAAARMRTLHA